MQRGGRRKNCRTLNYCVSCLFPNSHLRVTALSSRLDLPQRGEIKSSVWWLYVHLLKLPVSISWSCSDVHCHICGQWHWSSFLLCHWPHSCSSLWNILSIKVFWQRYGQLDWQKCSALYSQNISTANRLQRHCYETGTLFKEEGSSEQLFYNSNNYPEAGNPRTLGRI